MKIVPISKHEYKVYPIYENDPYIEISQEEFNGLENRTKCFNAKLNKVIEYVKTAEEVAKEEQERARQVIQLRIAELKRLLSASDYKAIKYAEGLISAEDYEETKSTRQAWRDEINALESELSEGGGV